MTNTPVRIQRKRTKGWRMPINTVYVGRPSKFGNPIRIRIANLIPHSFIYVVKNNEEAVLAFKEWILEEERFILREQIKKELKGKNLACWCPLNQPCHGDVLLQIANKENI